MTLSMIVANIHRLPPSTETLDVLGRICDRYGLGSDQDLRMIMALSNTVISGSWALLALFPDSFVPGDLDFYTRNATSTCPNFLFSFLKTCGFRIVSCADVNYTAELDPNATEIQKVYKLSNDTTFINIIVSRSPSEIKPIFEFHSTLLMNFIAWYGVVSLYPELTLQRRGLINHDVLSSRIAECIIKYRERGFDLQHNLSHWEQTRAHTCGHTTYCPDSHRYIHDRSVHFISFIEGFDLMDFMGYIGWELRIQCRG